MKLRKEEKAFIKAWADLYKCPYTTTVTKGLDEHIKFGNNSWFWLRGRFKRIRMGKVYTIEELLK